jgi:hypothetical protein
MPEAATAKKFRKEYQPKDPSTGEPIGPPQVFEADTREELVDKIAAAHENASVRLYEIKKAAAVGAVLDYEPEQPLRQIQSRALTADERIKIAELRKNPATADQATKIEMEALLGTSIEDVQKMFNKIEIDKRTAFYEAETAAWLKKHPEFVNSESNRETMWKWLVKRNVPPTTKNLEYAYEALTADGLLVVQAKRTETPAATPPPAATTAPVETPAAAAATTETVPPAAATVPPSDPAIPAQTTQASEITETPEQVRARTSSSGLGRSNASVPSGAPAAPKVKEITFAFINSMDSVTYAKWVAEPANKAAVEKLYAGTSTRTRL